MNEIIAEIDALILSLNGDQDLRERCRQIIEELNEDKGPTEPR